MDVKEELLSTLKHNRLLAHRTLFPHRHTEADAPFHPKMISMFSSEHRLVAAQAFRGSAKTTLLEETGTLAALFRESEYILLIGPSWEDACDRLFAIKQELESNDSLVELFGDQRSEPWSADTLVLANGCKIKAVGVGQGLRGKKHGAKRPDLALIDDLEDEQSINTEESRKKTDRWLMSVLLPALHPTKGKIRFIGTAIHPKALIEKKCNDKKWLSAKFPAINIDLETGEEKSAWPDRFPLEEIKKIQETYTENGNLIEFNQEYMCTAEDVAGKPFQTNMIKVSPVPAVYMPVYIIVDPARTVKSKSARTGYIAASWAGSKLAVHDALGAFHRPDEIIKTIFEWNDKYSPIHVGVETNALEEFIMQPLRATALEKKISIPLLDLRAPVDKEQFIKSLQPFYMSGNVVHTKHLPDLESELLQFPTGRRDVVNALAYMLKVKAGRAVYEDFTDNHISPILEVSRTLPRCLVVSSRPAMTSAALLQYVDGEIRIIHDWIQNVPPQEAFPNIFREALVCGGDIKVYSPAEQFDMFNNHGLPAAFKSQHVSATQTSLASRCEGVLGEHLRKNLRGGPAVLIHRDAKWVINALGGGYSRTLDKHGKLSDKPSDNQYRLIMEAIESFVLYIDKTGRISDTEDRNYAYTRNGTRYLSSLPGR